jgi:hypothetical protein
MTSVADFNVATDLKVEMYLPYEADNLFIIGISNIGGDDVLGASTSFIIGTSLIGGTDILTDQTTPGFAWQPFEAITNAVNINTGGRVQSSLYYQPEAGTASIMMQSLDYDPSVNKSVRPGAKIRVRVQKGAVNETLFSGWIDTINVAYGAEGWNTINIAATDAWKRIVNTRVVTYDTTIYHGGNHATPLEAITLAVNNAGYVMSASSQPLNHKLPTVSKTNVIVNTFINDALKTGLGISWVDQDSGEVVVVPRPTYTTVAPAGTWTIGNNHGDPYHLCMSDIKVAADGDVIFNSLRVENSNDANEYVVKIDQDSIDLYGQMALDVAINTTPDGQLVKWADEVFAQSPTKLVKSVQTPAINRIGTLTDAAFFTPGTLIGVKFTETPLNINDYYSVVKVSHSITPNNWMTNLELWKEF